VFKEAALGIRWFN